MIKKIRQFFDQAAEVVAYLESMRENDLVSARKHYLKFADSEEPRHIAMGARLHLMERKFDKAKELLEQAFSLASQKKGKRNRYICEYCRYYLSRIDGDENHLDYFINAHALRPSSALFDALPLLRRDKFEDPNLLEEKRRAAR